MGGGVAATGCFFAAQPARSRQNTSPVFLMLSVFALSRPLVDGNLGYTPRRGLPCEGGAACRRLILDGSGAGGGDGSQQIDRAS
jgi:hypothetical protein